MGTLPNWEVSKLVYGGTWMMGGATWDLSNRLTLMMQCNDIFVLRWGHSWEHRTSWHDSRIDRSLQEGPGVQDIQTIWM